MAHLIYLIIMVSVTVILLSCTDEGSRSTAASVHAMATNMTAEKFTEVSVDGEGYPGSFGNVVPGSRKSITYFASNIEEEFVVTWRSNTGVQQQMLSRPHDFDLSGKRTLIVEFEEDGGVRAYTEPVPW